MHIKALNETKHQGNDVETQHNSENEQLLTMNEETSLKTVHKTPEKRNKNLIIGDSVLKRIEQKGLNDQTTIISCSGAKILDLL